MDAIEGFKERFLTLMPHLNERQLRIAAALEARVLGYGGVSTVAEVSGIARGTIHRGLEELKDPKRAGELKIAPKLCCVVDGT